MNTIYLKKSVPALLYYPAGLLLTWIVAELERPHYAHGPSFFHLIALLFLVGGLLWAIANFLQVYAGKREYLLSLIVHLCIYGGLLALFFTL